MKNEELVKLYQAGNKSALEEIVKNNKGLILKMANKFYVELTNSIDINDLVQEGYIGLIIAAQKYNYSMKYHASFSTYSVYWIYSKMNRFIRTKNTNNETSLNTKLKDDEELEKIDLLECVDNGYENIEEKIYLEQLRLDLENLMNNNVTLRERNILKLHYGWDCKECTRTYIASMLKITNQRVRQIEISALRKLRQTEWVKGEYEKYYKSIKHNCVNVESKIDFMDKYFKGVF